ncbi:LOW QUALITY PROTEIN: MORC family CW-type zinc finger protein 3 [Hyla sarda]|uniref:LOW QUALITY PROTEIN: MORC family CW-type zinc finger protein 3 n=1 Tax=Hyla sarda TaxID=327740 RepID=UPI0024C468F3|nr:LOW QUALITY PROTEIN: MORC family CW-type zinc finger protein 3 [Hyla sarda]
MTRPQSPPGSGECSAVPCIFFYCPKMAAQTTDGIRLSALCPKFLHTNSTSHTWPFSAIAELIDNAYDPDVNAKQIWIDQTNIGDHLVLTFTDNGNGMNLDKLHKMLSFGFSDKVAVQGHVPIGLYGNGFKSGSMRLGKDAIVLTKNDSGMHVGMLSQTYLEDIKAEHVIVPIISFNKQKQLEKTRDSDTNLQAILRHSFLNTERALLAELDAILSKKGTRIMIWNIRRDKNGMPEFDFISDKYDIRIPEEFDGSSRKGYKKQERPDLVAPDSDYSLRAYCSILYLKPRMQIVLRGQKVQTQLVSKNLAHIEKDVYRPKSISHRPVKIIFGYNCRNKEHYGIMMYHKNRLIKAYMRVGCQLKANNMGVGVVGVIECNYLKPTHNKQDFDYTNDYRLTLTAVGEKLNDYWNEMKLKKDTLSVLVEDEQKRPDQTWAQCDTCLKWRKLPDGMGKLPSKWFCHMNPDPQFRDCNVPEEPEDDDEITHSTYEKTYKKRQSEMLAQAFTKPTILFTPPSKEVQMVLNNFQTHYRQTHAANSSPLGVSETSVQPGTTPSRLKHLTPMETSPVSAKRPRVTVTETIELPDGDDDDDLDDGDVIIIEDVSTPKPKNDKVQPQNGAGSSPVPMESLNGETSGMQVMSAATTQTDVPSITIKKEEDDSYDTPSQPIFINCNGTTTHNMQDQVNGDIEYYKRRCEELSKKMKHLEDIRCEQEVKKETSRPQAQSAPGSGDLNSKYDQALREISRLNLLCKKLQEMKAEPGSSTASDVNDTSEMDDMVLQLDDVFRKFDSCSAEKDQYKKEIEQIKLEKQKLEDQNDQLRRELQKLKEAANGHDASTSALDQERIKLRTLRIHVAQLLTTLMPELDLEQVDYDVDVVDEILVQVLEQAEKQANGHE